MAAAPAAAGRAAVDAVGIRCLPHGARPHNADQAEMPSATCRHATPPADRTRMSPMHGGERSDVRCKLVVHAPRPRVARPRAADGSVPPHAQLAAALADGRGCAAVAPSSRRCSSRCSTPSSAWPAPTRGAVRVVGADGPALDPVVAVGLPAPRAGASAGALARGAAPAPSRATPDSECVRSDLCGHDERVRGRRAGARVQARRRGAAAAPRPSGRHAQPDVRSRVRAAGRR